MTPWTSASAAQRRAQLEVILGAVAFSASVPAGKTLLADVSPLALSGALYLAAGLTLAAALLARPLDRPSVPGTDNLLRGGDWSWLAGAVLAGGVLAPLALFLGLQQVAGHVAGLLLNLEAVFTIALGALLQGERFGRRGWAGAAAVVLGAGLLSLPFGPEASGQATRLPGILLVTGACALWGLDNNLTQRVSLRDARQIVAIKGTVGGAASLALATSFGMLGGWTAARVACAGLLGALSFGLSIALFVRGLRSLGVLQTGALFALAPGFAAVFSFLFLREPANTPALTALGLMTAGALLVATDRHHHLHRHEALEHSHRHEHDEHHAHEHTPEELAASPHAHPHRHEPLAHSHPHVHDVHHRHSHPGRGRRDGRA